jgi:lipid-binding SYLF domain-containing protein
MRVTAGLLLCFAACSTGPKSAGEAQAIDQRANATVASMNARDPGLQSVLNSAYGYVVFPSIGKGGFIVGGAHGDGVVYEQGRVTGYATVNQASVGAQIGAQTFSQVLVFRDQADLNRLKAGQFNLGADISAVVLTAGAAASTQFKNGVAVFVMPNGGAMIDVSVNGQQIKFKPAA